MEPVIQCDRVRQLPLSLEMRLRVSSGLSTQRVLEIPEHLAFYHKFLDAQQFISFHYELFCIELFPKGIVRAAGEEAKDDCAGPAGGNIHSGARKGISLNSDLQ
jgi:hypothetical protein